MAVVIAERADTLWLTLLRPPVNAIDPEMVRSLAQAVVALKGQTGFRTVKQQVRGALQARLTALAETGTDPFLDAFDAA